MNKIIKGGLVGALIYLIIVFIGQNVSSQILAQLAKPIFTIFGSFTLKTSGLYAGAIIIGFVIGAIVGMILGTRKSKTSPQAKSKIKKRK